MEPDKPGKSWRTPTDKRGADNMSGRLREDSKSGLEERKPCLRTSAAPDEHAWGLGSR